MKRAILLAAVLVTGCAAPSISGNERGGVVTYGPRRGDQMVHGGGPHVALAMADEHCAKHGAQARATSSDTFAGVFLFDCVRN
jgi:hypothetical protein